MKAIVGKTLQKCDQPLVPGQNITTGRDYFTERFGRLTSLEDDFLRLGSAVYAADLAFKRPEREEFIRNIELVVPVVNFQAFARVKDDIEDALYTLSSDNWSVNFVADKGTPEPTRQWGQKQGVALLFSGGLDSLSAAAGFICENRPLLLVSHVTHNRTVEQSQKALSAGLNQKLRTSVDRFACRVFARSVRGFPFPKDADREESQRTRSFLFLTIACIAARRVGYRKIVAIAENGQFAIHLPLTAARVGPFSTHTAHPQFTVTMQRICRSLLSCDDLEIVNPYLYKTKAEVLSTVRENLRELFPLSVSCWRGARVKGSNHCGVCIPCLTRRIALEAIGLKYNEYQRDIFEEDIGSLSPEDVGKRNLGDLLEFVREFSTYRVEEKDRLVENFPDLVNEYFDQDEAISMYVRFAAEALGVVGGYRKIRDLVR